MRYEAMANIKRRLSTILLYLGIIGAFTLCTAGKALAYTDTTSDITSCTDSTHYNGSLTCSNSYDGNTSSPWVSQTVNNPFSEYATYTFSSPKTIQKVSIYIIGTGSVCRLKDFTIDGYNGTSWDNLYTGTSPNTTESWQDFTFSNSTSYTQYRIYITTDYADGQQAGYNEIKFYENSTPTPTPTPTLTPTPTAGASTPTPMFVYVTNYPTQIPYPTALPTPTGEELPTQAPPEQREVDFDYSYAGAYSANYNLGLRNSSFLENPTFASDLNGFTPSYTSGYGYFTQLWFPYLVNQKIPMSVSVDGYLDVTQADTFYFNVFNQVSGTFHTQLSCGFTVSGGKIVSTAGTTEKPYTEEISETYSNKFLCTFYLNDDGTIQVTQYVNSKLIHTYSQAKISPDDWGTLPWAGGAFQFQFTTIDGVHLSSFNHLHIDDFINLGLNTGLSETNPDVCIKPTGFFPSIGSIINYYFCLLKNWFVKVMKDLFIPPDWEGVKKKMVSLQTLANVKSPLSYVIAPLTYLQSKNLDTEPAYSPIIIPIGMSTDAHTNISLDLRPESSIQTFLDNSIKPVLRYVVDLAFILIWYRIGAVFFDLDFLKGGNA